MRKLAAIALFASVLAAIAAYVLLAEHPPERRGVSEEFSAAEEPAPSSGEASAGPSSDATRAKERAVAEIDPAVRAAIERIDPENYRHKVVGAKTDFLLFGGEIGFVDVESIVRNGDPYSLVALLQAHDELSGADETLTLDLDYVGEDRGRNSTRFSQTIGGLPTPGRGHILFDDSGVVLMLKTVLIDPEGVRPNSVRIQKPEALYIASAAAADFVQPRRTRFEEAGKPLRVVDADGGGNVPPLLRYALDDANQLRLEWRIWLGTYNPYDSIEVLIDAETWAVLNVKSILETRAEQSAACNVDFRVCDGLLATQASCERTLLNPVDLIYGQRTVTIET